MDTADRPDLAGPSSPDPASPDPDARDPDATAPDATAPDATAPVPADAVHRADGEVRDRLVADPTLAARFTRTTTSSRPRRFVARYPGAVVATGCLAALAVVVGVRALSTDGSPAAATTGPAVVVTTTGPESGAPTASPSPASPTPASPTPAGTAPATSTAAAARTATPASSGSQSGRSASSRPLTSALSAGAPASTDLQVVAGAALARNPALRFAAQARRQLVDGLVDVRLSTVLATIAEQAALTVDSFQTVSGDPVGSPVRQATVGATDPADRAGVTRALSDQAGDYAVATGPAASTGRQTVRLRTVAPR